MSERKDDERLRDSFGARIQDADATPGCHSDETIWKAAQGESDAGTTGRVLDHVAGCPACAESWRMARAIAHEAAIAGAAKVLPFHRRPAVWTVGAIAASIALVALFFPAILDRRGPDPGDEFRAPASVALESRIDESARVPRDRVILRWGGAPEGAIYTLEVADQNLDVLIRSAPQDGTEYSVPAEALAGVPDGAKVYWRIEALLPDSTQVTSPVFLLQLQ